MVRYLVNIGGHSLRYRITIIMMMMMMMMMMIIMMMMMMMMMMMIVITIKTLPVIKNLEESEAMWISRKSFGTEWDMYN